MNAPLPIVRRVWTLLLLFVLSVPQIAADVRARTADDPPLAGTYAVGASGDFASPAEAVAALTARGVSAAVTFMVATGVYEGALALGVIEGASAAHTVRFVASGPVELVASGAATISLSGTGHVRFEGFTVRQDVPDHAAGHALEMQGGVVDVVFRDNVFIRPPGAGVSQHLVEATVVGGSVRFEGNTFEPGASMSIRGASPSSLLRLAMERNVVRSHLLLQSIVPAVIAANRFEAPVLGHWWWGTADEPGMVVNNVFRTPGQSFNVEDMRHIRVYHNTFGASTCAGYGVVIGQSTETHFVGNLVACSSAAVGAQASLFVRNASGVVVSDYNAFHSPGEVLAEVWTSVVNPPLRSLDDLRASEWWAGKDIHSIEGYVSLDADLRTDAPWLARAGTPLAAVPTDIEGNPRDPVAPSIGAHEYTSSRTLLPAGTYSVGAGGTYATLAAAADDLAERGAEGAVTFSLSGMHHGPIVLRDAYGINAGAPITLISASAESPAVLAGATPEPIVTLDGARHVVLRNLLFDLSGRPETTYHGLVLGPGVRDVQIRGVTFVDTPGAPLTRASVYLGGVSHAGVRMVENQFTGGGYAVTGLYGTSNLRAEGFVFSKNVVESGRGLIFHNLAAARIEANRVRVYTQGLLCYACRAMGAGDEVVEGLIANNAFHVEAGTAVDFYGNHQRFYHNTVAVDICGGGALVIAGMVNPTGFDLRNNIVACASGERVFSFFAGHTFTSDFNHFYSPGQHPFGAGSSAWGSLEEYQAATGFDPHSSFGEVPFVSATDLRLADVDDTAFRGTGETLPIVAVDLLGDARPNPPRQGAFEAAGSPVSADPVGPGAEPLAFALEAAYPNPAAVRATVPFTLSEGSHAVLTVWDLLGREVLRLVDGPVEAGRHAAEIEIGGLASGVYLLRLEAGASRATRRLTVVR